MFKSLSKVSSAPDDHFSAGPDRPVLVSACGRVVGAGGRPTVGAGIISPACVKAGGPCLSPPQTIISAAGPDCAVVRLGQSGALVTQVGAQLSSVHGGFPLAIRGRVYAPFATVVFIDTLRSIVCRGQSSKRPLLSGAESRQSNALLTLAWLDTRQRQRDRSRARRRVHVTLQAVASALPCDRSHLVTAHH